MYNNLPYNNTKTYLSNIQKYKIYFRFIFHLSKYKISFKNISGPKSDLGNQGKFTFMCTCI